MLLFLPPHTNKKPENLAMQNSAYYLQQVLFSNRIKLVSLCRMYYHQMSVQLETKYPDMKSFAANMDTEEGELEDEVDPLDKFLALFDSSTVDEDPISQDDVDTDFSSVTSQKQIKLFANSEELLYPRFANTSASSLWSIKMGAGGEVTRPCPQNPMEMKRVISDVVAEWQDLVAWKIPFELFRSTIIRLIHNMTPFNDRNRIVFDHVLVNFVLVQPLMFDQVVDAILERLILEYEKQHVPYDRGRSMFSALISCFQNESTLVLGGDVPNYPHFRLNVLKKICFQVDKLLVKIDSSSNTENINNNNNNTVSALLNWMIDCISGLLLSRLSASTSTSNDVGSSGLVVFEDFCSWLLNEVDLLMAADKSRVLSQPEIILRQTVLLCCEMYPANGGYMLEHIVSKLMFSSTSSSLPSAAVLSDRLARPHLLDPMVQKYFLSRALNVVSQILNQHLISSASSSLSCTTPTSTNTNTASAAATRVIKKKIGLPEILTTNPTSAAVQGSMVVINRLFGVLCNASEGVGANRRSSRSNAWFLEVWIPEIIQV